MNSSANEGVVFDKMDANTDSTAWDDEALIRMYDKTTSITYEKLQKRDKNSKTSSRAGKSTNQDVSTSSSGKAWKVGDTCMAMYEEDEKCYPAKIISVDPSKDKYEVVYTEYNENAVVSYDKLFRGAPTCTSSAYNDEVASKRRRLNDVKLESILNSSLNSATILPSNHTVIGESWRKSTSIPATSSSWKVSSSSDTSWSRQATTNTNSDLSASSRADYSHITTPLQSDCYRNTWKKCRVTTVDHAEFSTNATEELQNEPDIERNDNQIGSADLYALLNAGYPPEVLNEIVQNRLLKAGYNIGNVDSRLSDLSGNGTPVSCLPEEISAIRASSCEPEQKRARTYPPPLIGAPPPPSANLESTAEANDDTRALTPVNVKQHHSDTSSVCILSSANDSARKRAEFLKTTISSKPFKAMSYSGYDDYALFDPLLNASADGGRLRARTFKQTLVQSGLESINRSKHFLQSSPTFHRHHSNINYELRHKKKDTKGASGQQAKKSVQREPIMKLHKGFFPTSSDPPVYSRKQINEVSRASIITARKYASENQPKFANMKQVFDCRITKVVQQIADSCVGSLNRALKINGEDIVDGHEEIVFTEITKTVKRFIKLNSKRKPNCPPPISLKALEYGASAFKLYCEEIHERLRQLPNGKVENNERFDLSEDEVEWTDEDREHDDEEKASVSVLNNGKQETFPIPDLCPPPPPALFGKIAQAGNNKEAVCF